MAFKMVVSIWSACISKLANARDNVGLATILSNERSRGHEPDLQPLETENLHPFLLLNTVCSLSSHLT